MTVRRSGYRAPGWSRTPKPERRRQCPVGAVRRGRVHRRSAPLAGGYYNYPLIRLSGLWLEDVGFLQGQPFEVEVSRGKLVIRTV